MQYASGDPEVIEAGDAFYMPPGHVPRAWTPAHEFVQFSPTDELAATEAAIAAAMQAS